MKNKIFLIIGIIVCTLFGFSLYNEFIANHTYYYGMLANRENRKILIWVIIAIAIPLGYLFRNKKFSLFNLMMKWIPAGLITFGVAHTLIKETIFGSMGFIILCVNTLLLYFLGMYFILGIMGLGQRISDKRIKLGKTRRQELFINFGIGLGVFLLLLKILIIGNVLYGAVTRIIFLGLGYMFYIQRKNLLPYKENIENMIEDCNYKAIKKDTIYWIGIILVGISLIYYFYGFQLSFIPYSTAWDANHEYMYIPKILAANHGVLRGNTGPGATPPMLRHAFITFWFSLGNSIKLRIGADTIAVAMNFLSGIFVLLMGMGTIKEIINFFSPKKKNEDESQENIQKAEKITFYSGWFLILLRLTSGMGAFLVFVDNKTDLGVMCITILAILSGFIFLNYIKNNQENKEADTQALKYIIISGVFFALASMSKQTAFIDIALFGVLLIAIWINNIIALGVGIFITGMTGILQIGNAKDLMTPLAGKRVALIGAIIILGGIGQLIFQHQKSPIHKTLKKNIKHILIRAGSIIAMLIIFKGTHVAYSQITEGSRTPGNYVKALLLGKTDTKILLAAANTDRFAQQTAIDQTAKNDLSPVQCSQLSFSKEELKKDTKKANSTNEDVGRYVGYGRKEITKNKGFSLGYTLLRIIYPRDNFCYGLNHDAKILCTNGAAINTFDIKVLEPLLQQMSKGSQAYNILSGALSQFYKKGYKVSNVYNPTEFTDQMVSLRQFYQSHAIRAEQGKIYIPYRYIIPLNISFNWSLQNLSSYYTDIGFIRLFTLMFIILGAVYGCIKRDKGLITISIVSMIGRAIRWIIGGGILWYGMGLIIRTILATIMYIYHLIYEIKKEQDKNLLYIFLFLFAIRGVLQLFFNLIRISSQGSGGPFAWYKMNIGKTMELNSSLQQQEVLKNGYSRKDVFDLQFPHYNKFIEHVKNRKNEDGVLIAGTYIQYFLKNQRNIKMDGMLDWFWEQTSDNNDCKSIQRLKNNNIKYLVIDPNIGTVGMGEGNESLFQRFFAKLDPVTGKIQTNGGISMLVKLIQNGYLKLFSTNNLGAKYAFTLSDAAIKEGFPGITSADDMILTRAKLAIARYFPDANTYINFIATTFIQRIGNGLAISDIADVFGKDINEQKVIKAAEGLLNETQISQETLQIATKDLSQDERLILGQYLSLLNLSKSGNGQFQEVINNILGQSLGGSSQLMVFERI